MNINKFMIVFIANFWYYVFMGYVSRYSKTEDLIKLAMMFQNSYRGISIDDIAKSFECSNRTAERMKAIMLDLFAEKLEEVPSSERKKRWRFKKGSVNFLITFDDNDVCLLESVKEKLENYEDIVRIDEINSKIKVLTSKKKVKLNEQNLASIMEAEGYLVRNNNINNVNSKYMELIRGAILNSKKIEFIYGTGNDKQKRIKANPYGIKISDRYFLVAYSDKIKGIRQFDFNKMSELVLLDEKFERNNEFDLENCKDANSKSKIKKIVAEFDKSEKEYVLDSNFSKHQKFKILENGNVQVTLYKEITPEICLELVKWSYKVKIIEPEELKNTYKEFLNKILINL